MPTYDYKCNDCEYLFSEFQKMSDSPIKDCTQCKGEVRRIISGGSGMIFKGTGFYLTDYGKSGKPKEDKSTATKSTIKEGHKNE